MEIFNADGTTAGACGNGTRCVSSLIFEESKKKQITLEAPYKKVLTAWRGKQITVDMGKPKTAWQDIPLSKKSDTFLCAFVKIVVFRNFLCYNRKKQEKGGFSHGRSSEFPHRTGRI